MKHRKSDILWKVILEEVFPDLLQFIYSDADEVYNIERGFEYLDKELAELDPQPDEEKDSRFADKLVKAYHRDGVEEWVLLHVEIQDDTDNRRAFAERMYTYFYRIRDRYPGRFVSALAIFTRQDGQKMPDRFCMIIAVRASFMNIPHCLSLTIPMSNWTRVITHSLKLSLRRSCG